MVSKIFQSLYAHSSRGSIYHFLSRVMGMLNTCMVMPQGMTVRIGKHRMSPGSVDRILAIWLWKWGLLEGYETFLLKHIVAKGMRVLDIGANIGYYSLIFAELVGADGSVYAYEPDPDNYVVLLRNIQLNGYRNIVAVPKAVSADNRTISLYKNNGNRGDHRIYESDDGVRTRITVDAVRLDDAFKPGTRFDFIKMDIQGAEVAAFEGMERLLQDNPGIRIVVELMPEQYSRSGHDVVLFLKQLTQLHGFRLNYIDESARKIVPVSDEELLRMCASGFSPNLYLYR